MVHKDRNEENGYLLTRKREPINAWIAPPLDVAGEIQVFETMTAWQEKAGVAGLKASRVTNPSGEPSIVMQWNYPKTKSRGKCSLSPSRGYAVEWYEQYDANGRLYRRSTTSEWITQDGVSYPKRINDGSGYNYNPAGKANWTIEIEVTSLELQARKIPDSLFQVDVTVHG